MAANRGRSSTSLSQTRRSTANTLKNSRKFSFRLQSAPPLSIQQYLRASSGVLPGAKAWKVSGTYRIPTYRAYLSTETRQQPKKLEPVWHPPGRYREKQPTSLSPEAKVPEHIKEPVWQPPGKTIVKPLPYFDPPNLRWSLQDLRRSMPEMRPKTLRTSSSMSTARKTEEVQDV